LIWLSLPDHQNDDKALREHPPSRSGKETTSMLLLDHQDNNEAF
jgi:hypothetical protein